MNIATYAEVKTYMEGLASLNADIHSFCAGDIDRLQAHLEDSTKIIPGGPGHRVLFLEFPDVLPRDTDGSGDKRWRYGITVASIVKNQDWNDADSAMSANETILQQVLLRIRYDAHQGTTDMNIEDSGIMEPVKLKTVANLHGYRIEIYLQDYIDLHPDASKWSDLN